MKEQYACWKHRDDSLSLTRLDSPPADSGLTLLYTISTDSWEEAMARHHRRQGWEPYEPMKEPS